MAATLAQTSDDRSQLTAVFAYRSETAFSGILAALFSGHGYVPLNPNFPPERTRTMLMRAGCRRMIVDSESEKLLSQILEGMDESLVILLPEKNDVKTLSEHFPSHTFLSSADLLPPWEWVRNDPPVDSAAYVLFTSGSTGIPKGVMVSHRNVLSFIDVMVERYQVREEDRFSQMFDMTFDLSIFDMFLAWERGACVCCPTKKQVVIPNRFIRDSKISIWFSVPSTGIFMKSMRMLKPDEFPNLRLSLFCGEALPEKLVTAWSEAAPRSIIENLYGPTELTIACTLYRWNPETSPQECVNGVVPIGKEYPGMSVLVANEKLEEVAPGETGELLMTGPQLSLGYWRDSEKTAAAFVVPPGKNRIYYRTGDRVRRPAGDAPLVYLGRMDTQVQIRGHRVELGEVEAVLREEAQTDLAVALGWPVTPSGANGVVGFLKGPVGTHREIIAGLQRRLPEYMVPKELRIVVDFPLNSNGKIDRKALFNMLGEQ